MNRIEFMKQLEMLLQDISESERKEAIQYYNDYFDDAGIENESKIIQQLSSPEKVAQTIKAGLNDEGENGEFSETGFTDSRFADKKEMLNQSTSNQNYKKQNEAKKDDTLKIILIVLGCILAIPVGLPIICTAGGLLIGFIGAVIGILIAILGTTVGLLLGGIGFIGLGIVKMFATPPAGLVILGGGLMMLAIGILFLLLSVWILTKAIPYIFKGIICLFQKIIPKKGENAV